MIIPFAVLFTALLMVPPNDSSNLTVHKIYDEYLHVVVLRAARGYDARLPCGQGKVFLDGPSSYVVWLKDDKDFLYRFPEDESAPRSLDPNIIYGTTCEAGVCYDETSLLVKNMSDKDGGLYTCRVHYQASPSDEFMINIRLVEPAGKPHIHTETGETPENMNPISVGTNLTLICFLRDGPKDAILFWKRNGKPVESYTLPDESSVMIKITNITWDENMANYECLAQNADVSLPFTTNFSLKIKLQSIVTLLPNESFFEANVSTQIDCSVMSDVATPFKITWTLDNKPMDTETYYAMYNGVVKTSKLKFTPVLKDTNSELVCKAYSPKLNVTEEARTVLHVGERPTCVGIVLDGDDQQPHNSTLLAKFKCVVRANGRPFKIIWNYTDQMTTMNKAFPAIKEGENIYFSNFEWSIVVEKYFLLTCQAKNRFGLQIEPCRFDTDLLDPKHLLLEPTTPTATAPSKETKLQSIVTLLPDESFLEANVSTQIECSVMSDVETPFRIIWTLDNKPMDTEKYYAMYNGEIIASKLKFTPLLKDTNSELVCKAYSPKLNVTEEARTVLHVGERPTCVGIVLDGDDQQPHNSPLLAKFKCIVKDNERPSKIIWNYTDQMTTINTAFPAMKEGENIYYSNFEWSIVVEKYYLLTCQAKNRFGLQIEPCRFDTDLLDPKRLLLEPMTPTPTAPSKETKSATLEWYESVGVFLALLFSVLAALYFRKYWNSCKQKAQPLDACLLEPASENIAADGIYRREVDVANEAIPKIKEPKRRHSRMRPYNRVQMCRSPMSTGSSDTGEKPAINGPLPAEVQTPESPIDTDVAQSNNQLQLPKVLSPQIHGSAENGKEDIGSQFPLIDKVIAQSCLHDTCVVRGGKAYYCV